jgi:hypothetical protein
MLDKELEKLANATAKIVDALPAANQSERAGKVEQLALDDRIKADMAAENLLSLSQDRQERKNYANKSFKLVCWWLTGVFAILIFQGFLNEPVKLAALGTVFQIEFKLPDSVLLAVVGGTTASIISIFIVVANYLFPKR